MNICHISTMTGIGGVERLIIDYFTCQSRQFKHFLLTTSSIPELDQLVRDLNIPAFQPERKIRFDPSVFLQMVKWLDKNDIHLIHTYNANSNAWGNIAALFARKPMICSEHGSVWWIRPPIAWLDHLAYKRAKLCITNSIASKHFLINKYHISSQKIVVVYNGIPDFPKVNVTDLRDKLGLPNKHIVGSVGRLDTPKNFDLLIDSANILLKSRKDLIFLLIGGGPLEAEYRDKIAKLGIQDRFMITGWREDARNLMQVLDIFVSTSIHESFGNVLVEALLAEKPVIAPRIDGIPEIITNGENGLLLNPSENVIPRNTTGSTLYSPRVIMDGKLTVPLSISPSDLSNSIEYLLERPDIRETMGERGRKIALERFTIDIYVKKIENIYSMVMNKEISK